MAKVSYNKKLFVEGKDDQHVIWALCQRFQLQENYNVVECEGIDNLIERIPVEIKVSGIKTIGIIIDADLELNERWEGITQIFQNLGYTMPEEIPIDGLILNQEGKVKIAIWIMPNNDNNGMLEDFIRFLVPENDELLNLANSSLDTIESKNQNKYSNIHKSKALIHTWLAWQEDPGTPMGLAITKKYLTTDQETCKRLVSWLNVTFSD